MKSALTYVINETKSAIATALTHDCSVLTGNAREFSRVPGLRVVLPKDRA